MSNTKREARTTRKHARAVLREAHRKQQRLRREGYHREGSIGAMMYTGPRAGQTVITDEFWQGPNGQVEKVELVDVLDLLPPDSEEAAAERAKRATEGAS